MKKNSVTIVLLLFFFFFLIVPLGTLLIQVINVDSLDKIFIDKLTNALTNSCLISIIVTFLSTILAYFVASLIVKEPAKRKDNILLFLTIPMLVPTFTHAIGFISLWGNNGLINNLFNLNINIYGFWGIILCSISYGFPTALIMFVDLLDRENMRPYQVAESLGIPKFHQFIKIKLAYILKSTLFIMFTIFTMIITDYGIPAMIGGHTLTLTSFLYEQVVGKLNFAGGALISLILLSPSLIMFLVGLKTRSYGKSDYQKNNTIIINKKHKIFSFLVYVIIFLLISFPMISCLFISFVKKFPIDLTFSLEHINKVVEGGYLTYFMNSLLISFFTALFGVVVAFITGYVTTRIKNKSLSKVLHLLTILTTSVPGIVLAVSYMITFNSSILYGTMLILIIINVIRYLSVPYLNFVNEFDHIDSSIEKMSASLGIPLIYIIKDVIIPISTPVIKSSFAYIFVNTMATVTTVLFLATPFTKPLSLVIVELESHNFLEMAAFVSFIILATNIILKFVLANICKRKIAK